MPPPVRRTHDGASECCPRPSIGVANVREAPTAPELLSQDYAAWDPNAVAAHFPLPSAEVAARLVDLLLPRHTGRPNGDEAA
jgi:hypothetical protein